MPVLPRTESVSSPRRDPRQRIAPEDISLWFASIGSTPFVHAAHSLFQLSYVFCLFLRRASVWVRFCAQNLSPNPRGLLRQTSTSEMPVDAFENSQHLSRTARYPN